jgi:catechol 2,3-dioxygenase-like lactoylglutathione lyase family enzyme
MLQHVALEVREAETDAEVAFWGMLGFAEVTPAGTLRESTRWVQRGGTQIHLLFVAEPVIPPRGHVAVVTEAFAEVCARLAAAGRIPELRAEYWGAPRAHVSTPAGHRVELMQAPPPGAHA